MKTCKTCRFWKPDPALLDPYNGKCQHPRITPILDILQEGPGAWIYDFGNEIATLYPTADFGCVLHEEKAQP